MSGEQCQGDEPVPGPIRIHFAKYEWNSSLPQTNDLAVGGMGGLPYCRGQHGGFSTPLSGKRLEARSQICVGLLLGKSLECLVRAMHVAEAIPEAVQTSVGRRRVPHMGRALEA